MLINKKYIITYCSNIFKTKSFEKLISNIKKYTDELKNNKKNISLCLSKALLNDIIKKNNIKKIILLQKDKQIYISSINGFVYQDFHKKYIKEKIYLPDWTSKYRLLYTKNIILLIEKLNINKVSISTLPLSYKNWSIKKQYPMIIYKSIKNITKIITHTKLINISIEPEPYCLLECYSDVIKFYDNWIKKITKKNNKYIGLCYDICHFSVIFDKHEITLKSFKQKKIKIGKIQISSALKIIIPKKNIYIKLLLSTLSKIKRSNFLHQCIIKNKNTIRQYNDVLNMIKKITYEKNSEIKIHCHIPIYKKKFKYFNTTHSETKKVINYIKKNNTSQNLEIESYTYHFFFKKFCYTKSIKKEYEITTKE